MKLKVGYFGIGRLTFDTRLAEKNFQLISKKINLKYKNSIGIEKIVYTEIDAKNLIKEEIGLCKNIKDRSVRQAVHVSYY